MMVPFPGFEIAGTIGLVTELIPVAGMIVAVMMKIAVVVVVAVGGN